MRIYEVYKEVLVKGICVKMRKLIDYCLDLLTLSLWSTLYMHWFTVAYK